MEAPSTAKLVDQERRLLEAFGQYKAEWIGDRFAEVFRRPRYFGELETSTPVVLEGGRGTGKTTVLLGMQYQSRHRLIEREGGSLDAMAYWAIYYRADTSRLQAFTGPELHESEWTRIFSHYLNLILSISMVEMVCWAEGVIGRAPDPAAAQEFLSTLSLTLPVGGWAAIAKELKRKLVELEVYVNNLSGEKKPTLSMARAPIEALVEALGGSEPFRGRDIFILLDEFENFLDYQQRIVNTYVKHCRRPISYKIGVRPGGRRDRRTLNDFEILESPSDFELLDVIDRIRDEFFDWAREVCEQRLAHAIPSDAAFPDMKLLLPGLSLDEEIERLDGLGVVAAARKELVTNGYKHSRELLPSDVLLIKYESERRKCSVVEVAAEMSKDPNEWATRRSNYSSALVFYLNAGRRGGVRRKYYAGIEVLQQLAHFNIRVFLLLVSRAIVEGARRSGVVLHPVLPEPQTDAARDVALQLLTELQHHSEWGGRLKKLVLSLGRLFQVMAHDPLGHTVEVTCFSVASQSSEGTGKVQALLDEACARLALVRFPGTKPTSSGSTKEEEFMLHPVFAPFFETSYRHKRKIALTPVQIEGLVTSPKVTIESVLGSQGRSIDSAVPPQLSIFAQFLES